MARKVPRKDCRNCPDKPEPIKVIPIPRNKPTTPEHGVQLWQQAMFTCQSVIEMMHGYSLIGVAGDKTDQLHRLSGRLQQVIENCEKRNADSSAP
jgi:hypothetical protein